MFGLISSLFPAGSIVPKVFDAIVIAVLSLVLYFKGYHSANLACTKNMATAIVKNEKQYGQIKKDVTGSTSTNVDKYLSKWMRD